VTRTRTFAWLAIAVVAVAVLAVALWPRGSDPSIAARTRRLSSELRCVDCEGLSVADSSTDSARQTRRDIEARLRRGESESAIRRVYVDRFGESILLNPANSGIGLLVWMLPVVVLVLGAAGLFLALRRWQRQPRLDATPEDEAVVAEARREPAG
jgi:cytochrome c-type biogenesis protein CcmH